MGNLKVRVNSQAESKEAQELFFQLGYSKGACSEGNYPAIIVITQDWATGGYCSTRALGLDIPAHDKYKEITIQELRAMVSPMKEYLVPQNVGGFMYKKAYESKSIPDSWIEVPEGAEIAIQFKNVTDEHGVIFYKNSGKSCIGENDDGWQHDSDWSMDQLLNENYRDGDIDLSHDVLWQRDQSLNDQYAEIEQVRQHQHYFIDVSDVDEIDFYEVALRYNVTDPCIQHILKKCLAVGQRGQKDFHHDLKDIYDTAKRMLDVHGLDS